MCWPSVSAVSILKSAKISPYENYRFATVMPNV